MSVFSNAIYKIQAQQLLEGLRSPVWQSSPASNLKIDRGSASSPILTPEAALTDARGVSLAEAAQNRRSHLRTKCLIQGHIALFWNPEDTWMAQGAILNTGSGGILFEFNKNFDNGSRRLLRTPVLIRFILDPVKGTEREIEGLVVHTSFAGRTRIGISFTPDPRL